MIRETIRSLTHFYSMICQGKGVLDDTKIQSLADGAHALTSATTVLANQGELTTIDKAYLQEAEKISEQIDEMFVFLSTLEII